jgi:stage V sporulation protein G
MKDADGRAKLYADIAHPINSACREMIQDRVIQEFRREQQRSTQPGYISRYDDYDSDDDYLQEPAAWERESARTMDRPRIQPAEQEPRPPHTHRSPVDQPAERPDRGSQTDDFGAGIF